MHLFSFEIIFSYSGVKNKLPIKDHLQAFGSCCLKHWAEKYSKASS